MNMMLTGLREQRIEQRVIKMALGGLKLLPVHRHFNGVGMQADPKHGIRWLGLAAQKGQHEAQALLGQMLFNGDRAQRQAARGLMWLALAQDAATSDETWIKDSYKTALAKASEDDRAMALQMLERWVQGRRD